MRMCRPSSSSAWSRCARGRHPRHLRRGGHRLRADRHAVRHGAGRRGAGPRLPLQRPHRRLYADGGDGGPRSKVFEAFLGEASTGRCRTAIPSPPIRSLAPWRSPPGVVRRGGDARAHRAHQGRHRAMLAELSRAARTYAAAPARLHPRLRPEGCQAGYQSAQSQALKAWFLAHGLNIRPLGQTVYLMPPYCITDDELTRAYAGLIEGLDWLASGASRAIDDVPGDARRHLARRRGWRGEARRRQRRVALARASGRRPPSCGGETERVRVRRRDAPPRRRPAAADIEQPAGSPCSPAPRATRGSFGRRAWRRAARRRGRAACGARRGRDRIGKPMQRHARWR